jgi:hypothetical protein
LNVPPDYERRKKEAVEETLKFLENYCQRSNDDDTQQKNNNVEEEEEDSDNSEYDDEAPFSEMIIRSGPSELDVKISRLKTFVNALPFCTPLDLGFNALVLYVNADEWCYCPCTRNKFRKWRHRFQVDDNLDFDSCQKTLKLGPNPLIKHLEKMMELKNDCGTLHRLVYTYITHVYTNFTKIDRTDKWLNHKALYNPQSKHEREAAAAETQHIYKYVL